MSTTHTLSYGTYSADPVLAGGYQRIVSATFTRPSDTKEAAINATTTVDELAAYITSPAYSDWS